jgi:hypothetical protein
LPQPRPTGGKPAGGKPAAHLCGALCSSSARRACGRPAPACPHALCFLCGALCFATCARRALLRALLWSPRVDARDVIGLMSPWIDGPPLALPRSRSPRFAFARPEGGARAAAGRQTRGASPRPSNPRRRNRCSLTRTPSLDDCRPASACCRPAAVTPAILLLFSEYRWGRINLRPRSHGLGIFNILYGGAGGGGYSASDEYIRVSVASWSVEVIRM